jgi:hypothetical protein
MIKQALSILIMSQVQPDHLHAHLNQATPDEAHPIVAQSGFIASLLLPLPSPSYNPPVPEYPRFQALHDLLLRVG